MDKADDSSDGASVDSPGERMCRLAMEQGCVDSPWRKVARHCHRRLGTTATGAGAGRWWELGTALCDARYEVAELNGSVLGGSLDGSDAPTS